MNPNPLRMIVYVLLILMILALALFSNLNHRIMVSVVLIMLFLLIFTFIFKTGGHNLLKVAMIFATFLVLPVFILLYLNVFSHFWMTILSLIVVVILGVSSIVTMVKLDYVEFKWE